MHSSTQPQTKFDPGLADSELFSTFCREVRARQDEVERLARIPDDLFRSMKRIGLYRALVPKLLGGNERSPAEFLKMVEQIATADGSVGWVASFAGSVTYLSGLPTHRFDEIYALGPDVSFAAGLFPVQRVQTNNGKLVLNGRWKFASGCSGADWLGVGISVEEGDAAGKPRVVVFPRERAKLIDDWKVMGLAGTGSFDLVLEDVEVEEDWSFVRGGESTRLEPVYSFPVIPFSALNHAVVGLGVAQAALTETTASMVRSKHAARIADATVALHSAKAVVFGYCERVWEMILAGQSVSIRDKTMLRLAAKLASETAIKACRIALECINQEDDRAVHSQVERHLRDALVVGQHAFLSPAAYEQAGQILLGQETPLGFI